MEPQIIAAHDDLLLIRLILGIGSPIPRRLLRRSNRASIAIGIGIESDGVRKGKWRASLYRGLN
uniref:Uncharacterized protein n=1 Tax=Oryza rufipogon TaxID=4529 RepID=A0A0E0QV88_ORYRU